MKDEEKICCCKNAESEKTECCSSAAGAECAKGEQAACCCSGTEGEKPECCKHTERGEEERKKLINRLNRIEGQIRGIRAMVERNAYCPDILVQSSAVNAAINSFNKDLIASHIRNCVVRGVQEGDEQVITELVETLQKLMK